MNDEQSKKFLCLYCGEHGHLADRCDLWKTNNPTVPRELLPADKDALIAFYRSRPEMDRRPLEWKDDERQSTTYGSGQTGVDWRVYNTLSGYWGIDADDNEISVAGSRDEAKRIVQMLEDVRNGSMFTTVVVQRDYLDELESKNELIAQINEVDELILTEMKKYGAGDTCASDGTGVHSDMNPYDAAAIFALRELLLKVRAQ